MDLTLLDDVLVLLEEGNMTRAARRRNVTQPAFSRRIRSFENWLGRKIVTRTANRVEIEPALMANRVEMQALVAHVREVRRRIASYDPAQSTVTVAAQHSLIVSAFSEFAASALESFPTISFRVRAGNQNDCISLFLSGEASLLMCYEVEGGADLPFDPSVIRAVWGHDRLLPVVGREQRFTLSADGRTPDDVPIIRYPPSSFFGDLLARSQTSYRTSSGRTFVESAFVAGIKEITLAGLGVAWLPMSMIHREIQSGALLACSYDQADIVPLRVAIFSRPSDEAAAQLCWQCAAKEASEVLP